MTESDFDAIESNLRIVLPDSYRKIMMAYPFDGLPPADSHLPDNAAFLCSFNQQIRSDQIYGPRWDQKYYAIGASSDGDAYFIDTRLENSPVFRASQQHQTTKLISNSLMYWANQLVSWYVDFDVTNAEQVYREITRSLSAAGYFAQSPEPMDGWHRIVVSTKPDTGNSFWIAFVSGNWCLGTWGGTIYTSNSIQSTIEFVLDWFNYKSDGTAHDFESWIVEKHSLTVCSTDEFNQWTKSRIIGELPMTSNLEVKTVSANRIKIEMLCHFSENADRVLILEQSAEKTARILFKIDELVAKAHAYHSADIKCNTYLPDRIAWFDGANPIIYLKNSQEERTDEIRIHVDLDFNYEHSDWWY